MTDTEFLTWVHDRLVILHGENKNAAFMHKLRSVIQNIDQARDLLLEISKGQQAHIECTDRTSPTGLLIQELCTTYENKA